LPGGARDLHLPRICHLQARERISERAELLRDAALEDLQQGSDPVDRIACLSEIALPGSGWVSLVRRRQAPSAQVQKRHGGLGHHVGGADAAQFRLIGGPQLLFARLSGVLSRPGRLCHLVFGAQTVTSSG
jgi:hypothetical protein